jgi:hypothetical protein
MRPRTDGVIKNRPLWIKINVQENGTRIAAL